MKEVESILWFGKGRQFIIITIKIHDGHHHRREDYLRKEKEHEQKKSYGSSLIIDFFSVVVTKPDDGQWLFIFLSSFLFCTLFLQDKEDKNIDSRRISYSFLCVSRYLHPSQY